MPSTLSDVAREAGVAPSTVADILRGRPGYSPDTCRRIVETAERLNFVPNYFARSLQRKSSRTVGVAGHLEATGVTGPMLKAIAENLTLRGYMPLFCECSHYPEGEVRAVRELRGRFVDGIILDATSDAVLPNHIPCVMIRSIGVANHPCVVTDRFEAFAYGVRWLAERGHRRIAFLGADNAEAMRNPSNTHRLKMDGYRKAMEELGLFDEALLLDCGSKPGDTREFVRRGGDFFKTITAILASNDRIAIEAMTTLSALGVRVPEECSVSGFDDTEFAVAVSPQLTTFQPRRAEVGAKAVEMVLDLIAGKEVESVTLVPRLVERESAGPCRREVKRKR